MEMAWEMKEVRFCWLDCGNKIFDDRKEKNILETGHWEQNAQLWLF